MTMEFISQIELTPDEREIRSSVIDNIKGYTYFIIGSWEGIITKVDLNTFTRIATLILGAGPQTGYSTTSAIDEERGYLYVIGYRGGAYSPQGQPDLLHRIRLDNFQLDATLELPEGSIIPTLIDKTNNKLYIADASNRPYLIKIDLNTFTVEDTLDINDTIPYDFVFTWGGIIDVPRQLLYLISDQEPGKIAKFDLTTFTKVGILSLEPDDVYLEQIVFDHVNNFLYVAANNLSGLPAKIVKIDAANLNVVGSITLQSGENWVMTFQPQFTINNFAYFVSNWPYPYEIIKVNTNPFQRVEAFNITGGNDYPQNIIFDEQGYGYIGTSLSGESPARIIKIQDPDAIISQIACPLAPKYSGDDITLQATPKDGIGPYTVIFKKNNSVIDISRLGNQSNPIGNVQEDTTITRVYTLDDIDIVNATEGIITFSVLISDSCPTGAQTCTESCIINIGCVAPVCNFIVT